jgi:hypothetical protein
MRSLTLIACENNVSKMGWGGCADAPGQRLLIGAGSVGVIKQKTFSHSQNVRLFGIQVPGAEANSTHVGIGHKQRGFEALRMPKKA